MLENLENTLQSLIEKHLASIVSDTTAVQLAHQLGQGLQNNLRWAPDNLTMLPDTFTLIMHPDTIRQWNQNPHALESFH